LFVAYIINPVFAVSFMKHEYNVKRYNTNWKKIADLNGLSCLSPVLIFYIGKVTG